MPTHADLVADPAGFIRDYVYVCRHNGHGINNMAELLNHATFNTPQADPCNVGLVDTHLPVIPGGIPAAVGNNISGQVLPDPISLTPRTWFWFDVVPGNNYFWTTVNVPVMADIVLHGADPGGPGPVQDRRAYFLPYSHNRITHMTLGANANFFFTSALSGCSVFIYRPPVGPVTVYHANAGNVPARQKNVYMERAFLAVAGIPPPITAHNVSIFSTRALVGEVPPRPQLRWRQTLRKQLQLRRNIRWLTQGANIMGHRNAAGNWDFYWQRVGFMQYNRPRIDNIIRMLTCKGQRNVQVNKLTSLAVTAFGQL